MVTTMASVKLVNGHLSHHHSSPYHHPHHRPPPSHLNNNNASSHHDHNHPLIRPPSSPSPGAAQDVTLDFSVRRRSARAEESADEAESDIGPRDLSSPPQSPPDPTRGDPLGLLETPTKKNKRKLSEPKKRAAEVTVKRLRPDSPHNDEGNIAADSNSNPDTTESNNTQEAVSRGGKGKRKDSNNHGKKLSCPSNTSSSKFHSGKSQPHLTRDSPVSSSSSPSAQEGEDAAKGSVGEGSSGSSPSVPPNGVPSHFLPHVFPGVPPAAAALGYLPALYFSGRPYPHPGLHASFPTLPLHLQQSYIAAAAAAAAAATAQSTSLPSTSTFSASDASTSSKSGASSSKNKAETNVSDSRVSDHPTAHPKAAKSSATSSNHRTSTPSSSRLHPVPPPSSMTPLPHPSMHQLPFPLHAGTSRDEDKDDSDPGRSQSPEDLSLGGKMSRKHRKNYKNMTRERRVEANARERTRVHTISAAFDALRRAVPSYSYNQKLSKLAILRIACSYIMSLARLADQDYTSASEHIGKPLSFADCVDMCTNTIQTEGRARRRH
ncbi:zinc finger protein rsv1 [Aplysia californica]|uniref:Zinc finger protein rsv1 n=1 Tax=Aplysia californica TaxID=6500 RepID=A0ABM0JC50_APLCA|nr:zinc finger protein rsv1 [Aplysia californica]